MAGPAEASTGAVSVSASPKGGGTVAPIPWLLLGSHELDCMVLSGGPGLLVGRPVTETALQLQSVQGGGRGGSSGCASPPSHLTAQLDAPSACSLPLQTVGTISPMTVSHGGA